MATAFALQLPWALVLSWIDVREHRLPNLLVLAMTGAVFLGAGASAFLVADQFRTVAFAFILALAIGLGAVLVALFVPGALGMGDAKVTVSTVFLASLAGVSGLLGAFVWTCLVGGLAAVFIFVRTRDAKTRFAFGPVLLSAPWGGALLESLGVVG